MSEETNDPRPKPGSLAELPFVIAAALSTVAAMGTLATWTYEPIANATNTPIALTAHALATAVVAIAANVLFLSFDP